MVHSIQQILMIHVLTFHESKHIALNKQKTKL